MSNHISDIQHQIDSVQKEFYENQSKHVFFKNKQKLECAKRVSDSIDINKMIQMTIFNIPNTNKVYYTYPLFKSYAHEDVYLKVYDYLYTVLAATIETYGSFEMHINLNSFTISACRRYYSMITSSLDSNDVFTDKMTHMYVYYTPSVIDQVLQLLRNYVTKLKDKTTFYTKTESEECLKGLFEHISVVP